MLVLYPLKNGGHRLCHQRLMKICVLDAEDAKRSALQAFSRSSTAFQKSKIPTSALNAVPVLMSAPSKRSNLNNSIEKRKQNTIHTVHISS